MFSAVQSGKVKYGVIPFYNTTHGAVTATLDSFLTACFPAEVSDRQHSAKGGVPQECFADVRIRSEIVVAIKHNLLGQTLQHAETNQPEVNLSHIKKVYSHEQALGQCAGFLSKQLPGAERVAVSSTSKAAEMIAAAIAIGDEVDVAAISSTMAAEEYKVGVLWPGIQDRHDNATRFFTLERRSDQRELRADVISRSLLVFVVSHSQPGALFRVLERLFRHGLNMTGIHQRPPNEQRADDAIFIEIGGPISENVMEDLRTVTLHAMCLGSW